MVFSIFDCDPEIIMERLRPLLEIENFFFNEFKLVLHFFAVKFTGDYYAVGIIP